jgi:hypothetical protein
MTFRRRAAIALLLVVALFLPACTVTFLPDPTTPRVDVPRPAPTPTRFGVIERFESVQSVYRVGDRVAFRIRTQRPGYVTLTAFDPDGTTYVIARNVPVRGNRTETIPDPFGRTTFVAYPPTGPHIVRAHFTPEPTPERVSFRGIGSMDAWTNAIFLEIRVFGFGLDDVAEVRFDIRR